MVKPIRIEYAGELYHVTSRGNFQEGFILLMKIAQIFS